MKTVKTLIFMKLKCGYLKDEMVSHNKTLCSNKDLS